MGLVAHFLLERAGVRLNETALPPHVRSIILDACEGAGVSLIDLVVRGQHRQLKLEIMIDAPDGITHEHCRAVSRSIDDRMQDDDFLDRVKAVDVSSPGADSPVKFLWQLTKHVGRTVRVKRADGTEIEGELLTANDSLLVVAPPKQKHRKEPEPPTTIPASEVSEARIVIRI
jgi:ribosome maturation factor RimP